MQSRRPVPYLGPLFVLGMVAAIGIASVTAVDFSKRRDRIEYTVGSGSSAMLESELGGVGEALPERNAQARTPGGNE